MQVLKAALELDQDEVEGAKEDLNRAGGDPQSRIKKMVEEHEAAQHGSTPAIGSAATSSSDRGLASQIQEWIRMIQKVLRLQEAQLSEEKRTATLTGRHHTVEKQVYV